MPKNPPAVTSENLGAWLLKGSPDLSDIDELIRTRFETVDGWCLRKSYRAGLVEQGQPVLFWMSGSSAHQPAGIYAQGHTSGAAARDEAEDGRTQLFMPVALTPLSEPVLRADLVQHPELSQIEVIRMAAGSNPSFVTRAAMAALRSGWPQVRVDWREPRGLGTESQC